MLVWLGPNLFIVCDCWDGRHMWQTHTWSVYPLLALSTAGLAMSFALLRRPEGYSSWRRGRWNHLLSLASILLRLLLHVPLFCVEERALVAF